MEFLNEAFEQVQKAFHCPTCGEPYSKDSIKLKGFLNQTFIFRAYCDNKHTPTIAECVLYIDKNNIQPITNQDVIDIKHQIKCFDGNFEKLFKKK